MERIRLGHGSGGSLMHELISTLFGPAFCIEEFGDSALLGIGRERLAFTTDSYVVSPLFFPGGNIGELAVFGTVNDLAVSGAVPLYLSAGLIIEEGFPLDDLRTIIASMAGAAGKAGVRVVAGDTKVVNKGKGDGVFINTAGIGLVAEGISISTARIRPGDIVIVSGEIGCHGMAVMGERNGITFNPPLLSDTRPLNGLVSAMLETTKEIRFMRDPTRGGLATALKEAASESKTCIRIREEALPVPGPVRGACELLGFDPIYVANEGILVAVTGPGCADILLDAMRLHPFGAKARIIGEVTDAPAGTVLLETAIGGTRVVEMLQGEQLPRIC